MRRNGFVRVLFCAVTLALLATPGGAAMAQDGGGLVTMTVEAGLVTWEPLVENGGLALTVSGPGSYHLQETFAAGEAATLGARGMADGLYTYELLILPLEAAAPVDDAERGLGSGVEVLSVSGSLSILRGRFVPPDVGEEEGAGGEQWLRAPEDIPHYDDVIITGSLCVGFDCAVGESFGFDTIILKEHNLRIYFNDTSYAGSYPSRAWRITINSSSNGGASYFSVDDVDEGTSPFRVEGGGPSYSLYVDDYGRVGFGTSTPVVEAHIKDSDTPTVRLEQDGSGGWTPQTFDVAGNESNFFIRDATNGSKLPFRIEPNTPSSTLCLKEEGYVGVGTWSPGEALHVHGTDGNTALKVEEASGTTAARALLLLANNGTPRIAFQNTDNSAVWNVAMLGDNFAIMKGLPAAADRQLVIQEDGDLVIAGLLTENSDANDKQDLVAVDGGEVLAAVAELPISTWSYVDDESGARHLGPMAQDFHATFGLGATGTGIASLDTSGVALAAIQGLNEVVEEKDARIEVLEAQNADLEARVAALEQVAGLRPVSFVALLPWLLSALLLLGLGLALGRRAGKSASEQVCG